MTNQPRLKAVKSDGSVIWIHQIPAATNQLIPGTPMRLLPLVSSPYKKAVPNSCTVQTPRFSGQHGPTLLPSQGTQLLTTRLPGQSPASCLQQEETTGPGQQPLRSQMISQASQSVRLINPPVDAARASQDNHSPVKKSEFMESSGQNETSGGKNPVFTGSYPPAPHSRQCLVGDKSSETSQPFTPPDLNFSGNLVNAPISGGTTKDSAVLSSPPFLYNQPEDEQLPGIRRLRYIFKAIFGEVDIGK